MGKYCRNRSRSRSRSRCICNSNSNSDGFLSEILDITEIIAIQIELISSQTTLQMSFSQTNTLLNSLAYSSNLGESITVLFTEASSLITAINTLSTGITTLLSNNAGLSYYLNLLLYILRGSRCCNNTSISVENIQTILNLSNNLNTELTSFNNTTLTLLTESVSLSNLLTNPTPPTPAQLTNTIQTLQSINTMLNNSSSSIIQNIQTEITLTNQFLTNALQSPLQL